jgi:hypothetical protein
LNTKCYGLKFDKTEECRGCQYREWCEEAADLPLIGRLKAFTNTVDTSTEEIAAIDDETKDVAVYTASEMATVIRWCLTVRTIKGSDLQLVIMKLLEPGISLAEIGKRRGISRQGVMQRINVVLRQFPELTTVLRNRSKRRRG